MPIRLAGSKTCKRDSPRLLVLSMLAAWVITLVCGCGLKPENSNNGKPSPPMVVSELPGAADSLAIDALFDVPPVPVGESDIEDGFILSRIDAYLDPEATVGQVNAGLAEVDGAIVTMSPRGTVLTIAVQRQPTFVALQRLAKILTDTPAFIGAVPGRESSAEELPPGAAGQPQNRAELDHLLPARFPAAWNARRLALNTCASGAVVTVIVADRFSGLDPSRLRLHLSDFLLHLSDFLSADLITAGEVHGAHVTITLAAQFNSENPTGANPFSQCLKIKGIPLNGLTSGQIPKRIKDFLPNGRFILNYSRGWNESWNEEEAVTPTSTFTRKMETNEWKVETKDRWSQFLAVTSAGNERGSPVAEAYPGTALAVLSNFLNVSTLSNYTLLDDPTLFGNIISLFPATFVAGVADNVLIVGSTDNNCASLFPEECRESRFSDSGSHVKAVGEQIPRVFHPTSGPIDRPLEGTSYSAPQVAGLASYMWLLSADLRNNLSPRTTIEAIVRNSTGHDLLINAYAAVLSLDAAELPTPTSAPVRHTILDVNEDGRFNQHDLTAYLAAYVGPNTGRPVPSGPEDYGRHDLNGDGSTGGPTTTAFDLDRVGSTQYGNTVYTTVLQTIENQEVRYDENSMTDLRILCYYAYSPMYQGDQERRTDLLASHCQKLSFTFDDNLEGWSTATSGKEVDSVKWLSRGGKGVVKLDGSDFGTPDGLPNSWMFMKIVLPAGTTSLSFDTSAHNRPGADAELRVRLVDADGLSHTLLNWDLVSESDGWVRRTANISTFAGQPVTIFFEQRDDGEGIHEQRYIDNITIESNNSVGET